MHPDVIVLDMNFGAGRDSGEEGIQWLQKIKELEPNVPVVTMTAYGDVGIAVQALKSLGPVILSKSLGEMKRWSPPFRGPMHRLVLSKRWSDWR